MKRLFSCVITFILFLTATGVFAIFSQPVRSEWTGTVYIRADGRVDPPEAPITTYDDVTYMLTDDIVGSGDGIVVERDDIIIEGAGYTLHGGGSGYGINLDERTNVTVRNIKITAFTYGLWLHHSSNNNISRNNITANYANGIMLVDYSNNNTIFGNNIENNKYGIFLDHSSNNTFVSNSFVNCGLWVMNSYSNVVSDNLVNGKPLVYQEGASDIIVGEAGQVVLVHCNHITVKNLNLSNATIGVLLWRTNNTEISGNNVANNWYGVLIDGSLNNTIIGNNIENNEAGIWLDGSSNNNISRNNITSNKECSIAFRYSSKNTISGNNIKTNGWVGVWLLLKSLNNTIFGNNIENNSNGIFSEDSSNNNVSGNNVTANKEFGIWLLNCSYTIISGNNVTANKECGIALGYSLNNTIFGNNIENNLHGILFGFSSNNNIYHNNFIDNSEQVISYYFANVWDNGYPYGGNFWSDYNGTDADCDGIGDTPYVIDSNNTDRYPLIAPIKVFEVGTWDGISYNVDIISNSTMSSLHFNPEEGPFLRFNVTGKDGTSGFCRVTIPKDLLWAEDKWIITVGDLPITNYTIIQDPSQNHTHLYFTYNHSTQTVIIQGTHVIPEFPSTTLLPLLMVISMPAVVFAKKAQRRKT